MERRLGRGWILALALGTAGLLVFSVYWAENPMLFVERSPSVHLVGINRVLVGNATSFVSGNTSSGCVGCPVVIPAGSSFVIEIGEWMANANAAPGRIVTMNWSLVSSYPFELGWIDFGSTSMFSSHECDTVGPYGNGGFGIAAKLVIPYSYSDLPDFGNLTFTMNATSGSPCY